MSLVPANWSHLVAYFFGGVFGINALPHFVAGVMGHSFQSPFSSSPGKAHSSALSNVIWGSFNVVIAYFLTFKVGDFNIRLPAHATSFGLGGIFIAVFLARHFGKYNGGANPPPFVDRESK